MKALTEAQRKQKRIRASIIKANAAYKKATPAGRRVLIAQDAIEQIKLQKVEVREGFFCDIRRVLPDNGEAQLQELLHDPDAPQCSGCALGTLFLSSVRMRNQFKVDAFSDPEGEIIPLLKEFSQRQRELIEIAFEMGDGWYSVERHRTWGGGELVVTKQHREAMDWAIGFLSAGERECENTRLLILLENIVRNKGTLVPTER